MCDGGIVDAPVWGASMKGAVTAQNFRALCELYGHVCLCCGNCFRRGLTADHVIPASRGGKNVLSNIQPLCRTCNARKGSKALDYRVWCNPHYARRAQYVGEAG